jgi:hypothetical protein
MKMRLNLAEPSPDWRGLAHVIAKSDTLRDDVTLVVEKDGLRFLDENLREIQTDLPAGMGTVESITLLSTKLFLLDWLYQRFPKQAAAGESPLHTRPRAGSYLKRDGAPGIHSAATQSTF